MAVSTSAALHRRVHQSLLADRERQLLVWMAGRLPRSIGSDHLTMLAFGGMVLTGGSFAALRATRWAVAGVLAGLAANWLGDSLDGTLARVRHQERPRYGFYVDHIVDLAGTAILFCGMACSGVMSPLVSLTVLVAYLLVAAEAFVAAHATATFRLSIMRIGPTELRILLGAGAVKLVDTPWVSLGPLGTVRLFDFGGTIASVALTITFTAMAILNSLELSEREPLPSAARAGVVTIAPDGPVQADDRIRRHAI